MICFFCLIEMEIDLVEFWVKGVVQSMISELESQGALPSSNSRVSSLATCCGPRGAKVLMKENIVEPMRDIRRALLEADGCENFSVLFILHLYFMLAFLLLECLFKL
ncbi:putative HAUS augmin-like complex subunit 6 [Helianthus annuus]|nr:putative HAUS augmin-like complex subunit 6 [Helianthus annuus]KAJ0650862.1 putative HAUS augmin-like complex subunit 6 [Helianthus annuus]KAJ0829460.1 hypothetical protein HanPSC8_Chr15g0644211 [Helianthus annuus]